ncbi:META domain-containing protein [Flavobacterium rhamnosiphilum]|uniref:META domain-containing protein n=1 Tax=Flavobacterium rhamnosiphilum TaxID=2541724 RepID=A0A4R5F7U9_9FLAO|nr:META domain-containing protein [Flavobacterium rhamnosiphilum]TDE44367.1 META domain-containing protein [Flavobacterium rhamnosiphilum]
MIRNVFFSIVLLTIVSCKTNKVPIQISSETESTPAYKEQMENLEQMIYFRATGNEPFWSLKISDNNIVFASLNAGFESFNAPFVAPIRAMDANVKMYRVATESGNMNIEIRQEECINSMSGAISPYVVKIEITKGKTDNSIVFNGCGTYITDAKLHDIWVLEKMNGENVTRTKFKREFPRIEINATTNKFFGFGGCNTMNGSLFFEKGLLRFTNIASTMMACEPQNRESEFLTSLQSTTSYSVENMKLTLKNQSGIELIFKKVD